MEFLRAGNPRCMKEDAGSQRALAPTVMPSGILEQILLETLKPPDIRWDRPWMRWEGANRDVA